MVTEPVALSSCRGVISSSARATSLLRGNIVVDPSPQVGMGHPPVARTPIHAGQVLIHDIAIASFSQFESVHVANPTLRRVVAQNPLSVPLRRGRVSESYSRTTIFRYSLYHLTSQRPQGHLSRPRRPELGPSTRRDLNPGASSGPARRIAWNRLVCERHARTCH